MYNKKVSWQLKIGEFKNWKSVDTLYLIKPFIFPQGKAPAASVFFLTARIFFQDEVVLVMPEAYKEENQVTDGKILACAYT